MSLLESLQMSHPGSMDFRHLSDRTPGNLLGILIELGLNSLRHNLRLNVMVHRLVMMDRLHWLLVVDGLYGLLMVDGLYGLLRQQDAVHLITDFWWQGGKDGQDVAVGFVEVGLGGRHFGGVLGWDAVHMVGQGTVPYWAGWFRRRVRVVLHELAGCQSQASTNNELKYK